MKRVGSEVTVKVGRSSRMEGMCPAQVPRPGVTPLCVPQRSRVADEDYGPTGTPLLKKVEQVQLLVAFMEAPPRHRGKY